MSALAITISMLASAEAKNGQSSARSANAARSWPAAADPKPYQPGSITRACDHENTHGIARRSSMRSERVREAGRLPMFKEEISLIGVDSRKKVAKPGVS